MALYRKTLITIAILVAIVAGCSASPASPTYTAVPPASSTRTGAPASATPLPSPAPSSSPTATKTPKPTSTFTPVLPSPTATISATLTPVPPQSIRFAVIGDYGTDAQPLKDVSDLIKSWNPDLIITTGDNNYKYGSADTIDQNVGKYFHDFIYPYQGQYGQGAQTNRFFPSLGNHDWVQPGAQPYLDYFTLPGNERYYNFTWGPVEFFALDSDEHEPDGVGVSSKQAKWLQEQLSLSLAPWKIVYFHHPPFSSSSYHGSTAWMQWPFAQWGASAVFSGHDHTYERLSVDGIPYFIDGVGGGGIYDFGTPLPGSEVRYNGDYGAMRVEASLESITFEFINRQGQIIDTYTIQKVALTYITSYKCPFVCHS